MTDDAASSIAERQASVRRAILAGPRGSGSAFPLVAADGSLVGPFGLMERFPTWGEPLQALGSSLRYESRLDERVRELIILTVAASLGSRFEIAAHTAVALSIGIEEHDIASALDGSYRPVDDLEAAALDLTRLLLRGGTDAGTRMSDEQAADVVLLVGYYRLLAQLMHQFGVDAVTA